MNNRPYAPNESEQAIRHHILTGSTCKLLAYNPRYNKVPIVYFHYWIFPAIYHQQIDVFFDKRNEPIGFITWAYMDSSTRAQIRSGARTTLKLDEWNEGGEPCIMDFVYDSDNFRSIVTHMRRNMFKQEERILGLRKNKDFEVTGIRQFLRRPVNAPNAGLGRY